MERIRLREITPDNDAARQLYASLGFVEQQVNSDKVTACLKLGAV